MHERNTRISSLPAWTFGGCIVHVRRMSITNLSVFKSTFGQLAMLPCSARPARTRPSGTRIRHSPEIILLVTLPRVWPDEGMSENSHSCVIILSDTLKSCQLPILLFIPSLKILRQAYHPVIYPGTRPSHVLLAPRYLQMDMG